jgi:hypothetical protein
MEPLTGEKVYKLTEYIPVLYMVYKDIIFECNKGEQYIYGSTTTLCAAI